MRLFCTVLCRILFLRISFLLTVLFCAKFCRTELHYFVLQYIEAHCIELFCFILDYCFLLYFIGFYCIVLYCIVLCGTELYCVALYRIAFHVVLSCFLNYTFHTVLKVNVLFDSLLPDSNDPHSHKIF